MHQLVLRYDRIEGLTGAEFIFLVARTDLSLAPGQRLTLTGPSGCGKSTVLAALMRRLEPSASAVLIDRVDARQLRGDDLRTRIAWLRAGQLPG